MRTAAQPWGRWSAPQTIFNPKPNAKAKTGYCYFIYARPRSYTCPAGSDNTRLQAAPSPGHGNPGANGTYYGTYFVANWTTGNPATKYLRATSTFYYTLDTYWPYGQVILHSTIEGPKPPKAPKPGPPSCKGSTCM